MHRSLRRATTAAPSSPLVERGNVAAAQFHPEKSGSNGLALLANFVRRCAA